MAIFSLTWKSVKNRQVTALLTIFTIAISVALLLGVERVRTQTKQSFADTISGTDLIVGGRSGSVNLLLYSVFRIGNATNNIDWKSVEYIEKQKSVSWTIPISLGDSHRGYRVVGTNNAYFAHYRYGNKQPLEIKQGHQFEGLFNTVLGAEVAKKLGYKIGDNIVVAHGIADTHFSRHDNLPFTVTGILAPTGTPVDRSVHVSLEAIEAIHIGWQSGANMGVKVDASSLNPETLQPKQITALFVGLNSRIQTFAMQRKLNEYPYEPLSAIMPNLALHELWNMMAVAEQALFVVSVFVILAGFLGMLSSILTSLNERRREMAILRAMGATPLHIFLLLSYESLLLTLGGILAGVALISALMYGFAPWILANYGIMLSVGFPSSHEWVLLAIIMLAGFIVGAIPALFAYYRSLSDGMTIKI